MTVSELGAQIRARKISCVELIQRTLDDIQARDKFCSLITVTGEQALATARERDAELAAGKYRGPFHGIPIALKDLFYTRGVRTTAGSRSTKILFLILMPRWWSNFMMPEPFPSAKRTCMRLLSASRQKIRILASC